MKSKVFIALGSNLGDSVSNVFTAVAHLKKLAVGKLWKLSSLYQTRAEDGSGPDYVNAVCMFETKLSADALLALLLLLEKKAKRKRSIRNAPRTLDLDLLFYGEKIVQSYELQLPHPRLHSRAFVLVPLNEIAPEWVHPILKKSVKEMLCELSAENLLGVKQLKMESLKTGSPPARG